jgi:transitional endoplasmic reticulum ATPase
MEFEALKAALAATPHNMPLLVIVGKMHEDRFEVGGESSEATVRLESLCEKQPKFAPARLLRSRIDAHLETDRKNYFARGAR